MKLFPFLIAITFLALSCNNVAPTTTSEPPPMDTIVAPPTTIQETKSTPIDFDTTQWADLSLLDSTFVLDMKYATTDNFVKVQLYDCARCFLRPAVAKAVLAAHEELKTQGYGGFKFFDCYRPRPIQYKLWEIYPNPGYVADPKKGSIHNRGGAVDLTIIDKEGNELDMGTPFDFFGKKANHTYTDLPKEVLDNRNMLKALMKKHGFASIRTEWWHYNYERQKYPLAEMVWPCK